MNLIPCSEDCLYQTDGCCTLEKPAQVTGSAAHGCVHFVRKKTAEQPSAVSEETKLISEAPQMPHGSF